MGLGMLAGFWVVLGVWFLAVFGVEAVVLSPRMQYLARMYKA